MEENAVNIGDTSSALASEQIEPYVYCITKQLEEVNLLASIYCSSGEMEVLEPQVVDNFHEFLQEPTASKRDALLEDNIELMIKLPLSGYKEKIEVRIELPLLYPQLENALVTIHTPLLSKVKEDAFRKAIEEFIGAMDKSEPYIFQVISWIQEQIDDLLEQPDTEDLSLSQTQLHTTSLPADNIADGTVEFERLWIYSHHIKSNTKRHEIIKQGRSLDLSGFSRPGKPGIICVEGLRENTQEFWRIIKGLHWQKIGICKSETKTIEYGKLDNLRRFDGFKEQLYAQEDEEEAEAEAKDKDKDKGSGVMDMALFIKYLEAHNSGYMKKELFGLA